MTFTSKEPILSISVAADQLNLNRATLRTWEALGVLKPYRSQGKRRLYSMHDLEQAKTILFLTHKAGVNLAGVKILLSQFPDLTSEKAERFAKDAGITTEEQQLNALMFLKRGRKKTKGGN